MTLTRAERWEETGRLASGGVQAREASRRAGRDGLCLPQAPAHVLWPVSLPSPALLPYLLPPSQGTERAYMLTPLASESMHSRRNGLLWVVRNVQSAQGNQQFFGTV